MIEAELPENEDERLAALRSYDVLDTDAEQAFDDLTQIASNVCGTPIALVSLVDGERQWFKSRVGLDAEETPRELAFCSHAILEPEEILIVPDSLSDPRFCDNPIVVGEPRVRFYAGSPLVNPDGMPLGTLCVIDSKPRQLSQEQVEALAALSRQVVSQLELRRANARLGDLANELGRSNTELRQFTSIAAHDLQEPLRKLVAFSDLLSRDLGDDLPRQAKEDLEHITDASERMQQLVHDLLQLSRAASSDLDARPVSLDDCVAHALKAVSMRIEETEAEVSIDPLPTVEGDSTLLTQLFQNLIGNALKFADGRPEVRVTCESENGTTIFGVRDNGIGMDPEYAGQIFAPFKRLHGRTEYEGTGIGLAIARKVIDRHHGEIWVESSPGQGAHFRFTLAGKVEPQSVAEAA